MRRQLSLIFTLSAWLFATGSHWDLVQTYAWGSMIADFSGEMSLSAAVKKTFAAETMCNLCHAVADAKQSSEGDGTTPDAKSLGKILLVCAPSTAMCVGSASAGSGMTDLILSPLSVDRAAPPLPPPRRAA